jgi:hypothetical protein
MPKPEAGSDTSHCAAIANLLFRRHEAESWRGSRAPYPRRDQGLEASIAVPFWRGDTDDLLDLYEYIRDQQASC